MDIINYVVRAQISKSLTMPSILFTFYFNQNTNKVHIVIVGDYVFKFFHL